MGEAKAKSDEKKALFEKEPDNFIHIDDVIVGVFRKGEAMYPIIGKATRGELLIANGEISHKISQILTQMDIKYAMDKKEEKRILTPH